MTGTGESDDEIEVHWPPQPRRPLWPTMEGSRQVYQRVTRQTSRRSTEYSTQSGSVHGEDEEANVHSDSEYEDSEGYALSLHSSRESVTQDNTVERTVDHSPSFQTSSSKLQKTNTFANERYVQPSKNIRLYHLLMGMVVIVSVLYSFVQFRGQEDNDISHLPGMHVHRVESLVEKLLKSQINVVKEKYPSQKEDIWYQLRAGIKKVTRDEPHQPTTFLFLHTSAAKETSECLTKAIAKTAALFLNASTPIAIDGEDLGKAHNENLKSSQDPDDNGWIIEKYRPLVERNRAMIVYNLEKVPAPLAQAFHFFCDEVSPLVDKAVYLFTLSIPKYTSGRPGKVAEDFLDELWSSDLGDDIRGPLLTRITGAVVYVLPEHNLPDPCV